MTWSRDVGGDARTRDICCERGGSTASVEVGVGLGSAGDSSGGRGEGRGRERSDIWERVCKSVPSPLLLLSMCVDRLHQPRYLFHVTHPRLSPFSPTQEGDSGNPARDAGTAALLS